MRMGEFCIYNRPEWDLLTLLLSQGAQSSVSSAARASRRGRGSPNRFGVKVWMWPLLSVCPLARMTTERPGLVSVNWALLTPLNWTLKQLFLRRGRSRWKRKRAAFTCEWRTEVAAGNINFLIKLGGKWERCRKDVERMLCSNVFCSLI